MQDPMISCRNLGKSFRKHNLRHLLRHRLTGWFQKDHPANEFHALKNISFDVARGEGLAIVGGNGAGKSTLLSVLAGLVPPDHGTVEVRGRIAALMDLGSGFHPDLTGTENVYVNAALLGFSESQTREAFASIVAFAGIGDYIHEPLRTYSNGMNLRLGFSVAINVDPDILIVDEVLAVGDPEFQAQCLERIREFRRAGKTFLCVSHNRKTLEELCDQALWLDHGELVMHGSAGEVLEAYEGGVRA
jgi:ABC-type polysaccharide/polyol phosphate transport system ATPase subunit